MDFIKSDALISLISFGKPMLTNDSDKFSWIAVTPISPMKLEQMSLTYKLDWLAVLD